MSLPHMARIIELLQHYLKNEGIFDNSFGLKIFTKPRPHQNSLATGVRHDINDFRWVFDPF